MKAKYRVALCGVGPDGFATWTVDNDKAEQDLVAGLRLFTAGRFIRWITEWIEYEV